jgi:hypothetical protein
MATAAIVLANQRGDLIDAPPALLCHWPAARLRQMSGGRPRCDSANRSSQPACGRASWKWPAAGTQHGRRRLSSIVLAGLCNRAGTP